ncbi:MAG: Activator of Hsp90 ATPase 1 family protein [Verrucomicrobia bacterium]|nr:Activator of Hsp90 ATPase 1 family protein [Verrucomicrobiota bacterium]
MKTNQIKKEIEIKAPISRVWRALTNHREFSQWFGVKLEGPFKEGKKARGRITYPGFEHLTMEVEVQKMEPETYFSYTWHPFALDPAVDYSRETPTLVEFHLGEKKGGTLLVVTETGFDKIPAGRRAKAFRMNRSGWAEQMKNIKKHVAKK